MSRLKTNAPRGSIFENVTGVKVPQSRFNLSYKTMLTTSMGKLVPFYYEDVVPGDKFDIKCGMVSRMMPMVAPIMSDVDCEVRYFYVPYRLIWKNFEDYITGKGEHIHPYFKCSRFTVDGLTDLFGVLPEENNLITNKNRTFAINALPYRAYHLIYFEYFADENIQMGSDYTALKNDIDSDGESLQYGSGPYNSIQNVDWKKDYFTSALPWTQRGELAQIAGEVFLKPNTRQVQKIVNATDGTPWYTIDSDIDNGASDREINTSLLGIFGSGTNRNSLAGRKIKSESNSEQTAFVNAQIDPNGTLGVSIPINNLRMANAVQRFLERSALSGNRFSEYILGIFGVKCADSRLQRPEYLGGGRVPYTISQVVQTTQGQLDDEGSPFDNSTPQGNLAAVGEMRGVFGINKPTFFPEFGIVMGLLYVRPKANYYQGIRRYMNVGIYNDYNNAHEPIIKDRLEQYYNPFLAHLGEDGVMTSELYANDDVVENEFNLLTNNGDTQDYALFGFQSKYAYMKYRANEIHGEFRSSLDFWHLGRSFANIPRLNTLFLTCVPSDRIWAVNDRTDKLLFEIANIVDCVRPMPKYGTPNL